MRSSRRERNKRVHLICRSNSIITCILEIITGALSTSGLGLSYIIQIGLESCLPDFERCIANVDKISRSRYPHSDFGSAWGEYFLSFIYLWWLLFFGLICVSNKCILWFLCPSTHVVPSGNSAENANAVLFKLPFILSIKPYAKLAPDRTPVGIRPEYNDSNMAF